MFDIKAKSRKTSTNKSENSSPSPTTTSTTSSEFKFEYEHINTSYIEHSSVYQLFYVFEIGGSGGGGGSDELLPLYYASEPSEPIQTRVLTNAHLSSVSSSRDKITLWVVVTVSVLSALFLVGLIGTLIVLTLIKFKPSKFHKAAQIVTGGGASAVSGGSGQSKMGNGFMGGLAGMGANTGHGASLAAVNGLMRSKFDRCDDFLGILICFFL